MHNIIIALDCSPWAKDVAQAAQKIISQLSTPPVVTIAHGLVQPDYYVSGQYAPILGFNEHYNADISRLMEGGALEEAVIDFLEQVKKEAQLDDAQIKVVRGNPEESLPELIKQLGADLLIMGRQNHSIAKNQIGHVTLSLLKSIAIPIQIIPTKQDT